MLTLTIGEEPSKEPRHLVPGFVDRLVGGREQEVVLPPPDEGSLSTTPSERKSRPAPIPWPQISNLPSKEDPPSLRKGNLRPKLRFQELP